MELKTARLTLLIDPAKKAAFERLCARQDLTPSQVVRQLIRDYLTLHGVSYVPSGARGKSESDQATPRARARGAGTAAAAKARKRD
jgi:hypothetical protein